MKRHYWQYLIDSAGNAVDGAKINVYLANTLSYANIFTTESGANTTTEFTEILTDVDGFFDFWVSDLNSSPEFGYDYTQRFKITWSKPGLVTGGINNVDIIWAGGGSTDESYSHTFTMGSSAVETFELEDFCNRCLVYECTVTPSATGSLFDFEFCRDENFTESQYILEMVDVALVDNLPFYVKDYDSLSKLYVRITNYGAATDIAMELAYEKFA